VPSLAELASTVHWLVTHEPFSDLLILKKSRKFIYIYEEPPSDIA
jgi:hypothetical protein